MRVLFPMLAIVMLIGPGVSAEPVVTIDVQVSPHAIILDSTVNWCTVHTDIAFSAVVLDKLWLNTVEIEWTKADSLGNLVAKFKMSEVKEIVTEPSTDLTLYGVTKAGVTFQGTDTVMVKPGPKR